MQTGLIGFAMSALLLGSPGIGFAPLGHQSSSSLHAPQGATRSNAAQTREASSAPVRVAGAPTLSDSAAGEPLGAYGKLPLAFVPNAGQSDARVRYSAQVPGASFAFTEKDARFTLAKDAARGVALQLGFLRANPDPTLEGRRLGSGTVNYIIGRDPAAWHTGLPNYGELAYRNLWPGVDMVFKGADGRLEYEFLVQPGARVGDIGLAYRGAQDVSLDRSGNLQIETALGALTDTRPVSYQVIDGKRVPVASRFVLGGHGRYGFAVGTYDTRRQLVIDPGLVYSTFLGGSGADQGFGIAIDATGNAYVTGFTGSSTNFPTQSAFDTSYNGGSSDVFVTKLNASGTALVYSTYIGGSSTDQGLAIAIDDSGSAYVTGFTGSTNFPLQSALPPFVYQPFYGGGSTDAFVTKLSPAGSSLVFSTYAGGNGADQGLGIAVYPGGDVYVTGDTRSTNLRVTSHALQTTLRDGSDAFFLRLDRFAAAAGYMSYFGGNGEDSARAIAIDGSRNVYLTGGTTSTNFPTSAGSFDTTANGNEDALVTKLRYNGSTPGPPTSDIYAIDYSTYLGGGGLDRGQAIARDGAGNAYVTGLTSSSGANPFPTTAGAIATTYRGGNFDAFVTKLNPTGTAPLLYSTYLGGSGDDRGAGIAVDSGDNVSLTGRTNSANFPTTPGSFDTSWNLGDDAFVTKLGSAGSLVYSTFLGGSTGANGNNDRGQAIALDATAAYVTGFANSSDFPTTPGAYDTSHNGESDVFVTKLITIGAPATLVLTPVADTNQVGTPHTVTATVTDAGGQPVSGVTVRFTVTVSNPTSGSSTTNASGQATFTYTGTVAGPDAITAYADTNNNGVRDLTAVPPEPTGAAAKIWTPGPPVTLVLTPVTDTNEVGNPHTVTATVRDAFGNPVPNVTVRFSVSGANTASGSDVTDANGQATFTYTGTHAGTDTITAYADTNNNGVRDLLTVPPEPAGAATKIWTPGAPFRMTLEPAADTNQVGEQHCVTATVYDFFGNPVPGITVRFSVPTHVATFAHPFSGSDVTDANGEARFCFSASLPGADAIHAFADTNNNGVQDLTTVPPEPSADAAKVWTLPASTEFCEVKVTEGGWIIAVNDDRASFGGNARVPAGASEVQGQEQYTDHGPADARDVHSIELTAMTCTDDLHSATIFGRATIDGSGDFVFRIDVTDGGQGGSNDSYGIMMSDGYASGQRDLQGGNVTIHKT